ncbi:MAG: hypothetical protein ACR2F0_10065 [Chthoniobacterales bacterium]
MKTRPPRVNLDLEFLRLRQHFLQPARIFPARGSLLVRQGHQQLAALQRLSGAERFKIVLVLLHQQVDARDAAQVALVQNPDPAAIGHVLGRAHHDPLHRTDIRKLRGKHRRVRIFRRHGRRRRRRSLRARRHRASHAKAGDESEGNELAGGAHNGR